MKSKKQLKIRKNLFGLYAFIVLMIALTVVPIFDANAQTTTHGNLTFMATQEAIANAPELSHLLFDINPSALIAEDGVGHHNLPSEEVAPIIAFCAPTAFKTLYAKSNEVNLTKVKAIAITLTNNQEISELNLMNLKDFDELEYVSFTFTYDVCGGAKNSSCLLPIVQNMVKPGNTPLTILYQLSIPE